MICPFCDIELPVNDVVEHLVVTLNSKGLHHVHGPIEDKRMMANLIQRIAKEVGLILKVSVPK